MIDYATLLTLAEWHEKLSTFALPLSNIPRKAGHSKVEATEAGFLGNISAYRRGMEVKTESDIKQDIHNNLISYKFETKCKAKERNSQASSSFKPEEAASAKTARDFLQNRQEERKKRWRSSCWGRSEHQAVLQPELYMQTSTSTSHEQARPVLPAYLRL